MYTYATSSDDALGGCSRDEPIRRRTASQTSKLEAPIAGTTWDNPHPILQTFIKTKSSNNLCMPSYCLDFVC